jgi:hypothetical protein
MSYYALGGSVPQVAWVYIVRPFTKHRQSIDLMPHRDLACVFCNNGASMGESPKDTSRVLKMSYGSEHSGMTPHDQLLNVLHVPSRSFAVLERMLCLILGHPMWLHVEQ